MTDEEALAIYRGEGFAERTHRLAEFVCSQDEYLETDPELREAVWEIFGRRVEIAKQAIRAHLTDDGYAALEGIVNDLSSSDAYAGTEIPGWAKRELEARVIPEIDPAWLA